MELDFEKLPRFKIHAMRIMDMVPQWCQAHEVSRDAVVNQIYIAHAWADSNPRKAPRKNMVRFLFSWMGQAKRYGNLKTPEKKIVKTQMTEPDADMTLEEMREIRRKNMPNYRGLNAA